MVCSQFYAQREWIIGKLSASENGKEEFRITFPLTFVSTSSLMETVHEQFAGPDGRQPLFATVLRHSLTWARSSFTCAKAGEKTVIVKDLRSGCKCGVIPVHTKKKQQNQNRKRKQSGSNKPVDRPAPASAAEQQSDCESDVSNADSILSALAKELDKDKENTEDTGDGDALQRNDGDANKTATESESQRFERRSSCFLFQVQSGTTVSTCR